MGNVHAAGHAPPPSPPPPSPAGTAAEGSDNVSPGNSEADSNSAKSPQKETGPGSYEDLHRRCKDVFPSPFEGAKLLINKGLSNHFQISHTMTMSALSPSGYRFGCTYVGSNQFSPTESYPILVGDTDAGGNLNAQIIHKFKENVLTKMVAQIQNQKWMNTQLTTEYLGSDCHAGFTLGNIDLVGQSGLMLAQYVQNITKKLAIGTEYMYQYGANVPGGQIGLFSIAAKYDADNWCFSGRVTPLMGAAMLCYFQQANDVLALGVELEGSVRSQEFTTTVAYQLDMPSAQLNFRGQVDSNLCIGAVMEKKLQPLPFTFSLSGFANHLKGAYRFGIGLFVG